jgi:hypothetical protein
MAKLEGNIQFTGSLENLSFYKMRGCDKIVVRKKGGPSRKQVKQSPRFELTRRNNKEFGGRVQVVRYTRRMLHPLLFLADYNFTGPLNALLQPIQKMDTTTERGKRSILLSKNPRLLEGFTLNRNYLLDSIVRTPVSYTLQGEQVIIHIPDLLPGINFMAPGNYPWYRFIAVAGLLPDFYYMDDVYGYQPKGNMYTSATTITATTDWLPVNTHAAAMQLTLEGLPATKPDDHSIVVATGIAFGAMQGQKIQPVKYIGGARIIGVL